MFLSSPTCSAARSGQGKGLHGWGRLKASGGLSAHPSIQPPHFYFAFTPLETPFFLKNSLAAQSLHALTCSSFSRLYHFTPFGNKERQAERESRAGINAEPRRRQTRSRMNRHHRSAALAGWLCRAAGPLWREIISKLLQQADACQKMLSVKVRPLRCSLFPPPCLRRTAAFFIFSPLSAFLVPITACFSLLLRGFFCGFSTSAHLSYSSVSQESQRGLRTT